MPSPHKRRKDGRQKRVDIPHLDITHKSAKAHGATLWEGNPFPDLSRGRDASPTVGTPCRFIQSSFPKMLVTESLPRKSKRGSDHDNSSARFKNSPQFHLDENNGSILKSCYATRGEHKNLLRKFLIRRFIQ